MLCLSPDMVWSLMPNAYPIISNQFAPHPNTETLAKKQANAIYRRPFSQTQISAFSEADDWIKARRGKIILDSGCGTGDSSFWLSETFSDCLIVGVDQSAARLEKARARLDASKNNRILFIRARLEDF